MANLSNYAANAILDGDPIPATLYVQYHTGNPGANGTANVAAENDRPSFSRTVAANVAENTAIVETLNAAADEDLTHLSLWDSGTPGAGNCWGVGAISNAPVQVLVGNTIQINAGDLVITGTVWA